MSSESSLPSDTADAKAAKAQAKKRRRSAKAEARAASRSTTCAQGLVGAREDPLGLWRRHFPRATGQALDAGHFLAEERPAELNAAVLSHLRAASTEQGVPVPA